MKNTLLHSRIGVLITASLFTSASQAIIVTTNINYVSPGGSNTQLDVFQPDTPVTPGFPTIVNVHGGGWVSGDKSDVNAFCAQLARRGFPVVNINYTLATRAAQSHPQAVKDIKAAIRWVRSSASLPFNLPRAIIVSGSSAGGHLAMMVGATNNTALFNPDGAPPAGGYNVQGCISMWGVSDAVWDVLTFGPDSALATYIGEPLTAATLGLYRNASPITFAGSCDPPFVFFHGTADDVVPYQHSEMMANALRPFGIYAQVNLAVGAGHGFGGFGGFVGMANLVADAIPEMRESRNPADFNRDGGVDGSDVGAFFDAWEAGDDAGDINGDGGVNGDDVEAFFVTWENGGC